MNDHVEMIPVRPGNPRPLGRHVGHDLRNGLAQYRALVQPPQRAVRPFKSWVSRALFDQGTTSRCTCEAGVGLLRTSPHASRFTGRSKWDEPAERQAAYLDWQRFDPWWPQPHDGSTTDAPFRGLREAGEIVAWKWLFGEAEVREYLTWYGPVVVGTLWLDEMFYPGANSWLTLTGEVAGGHAYRIVQYSRTRDAYRIVNSWGYGWGAAGRAWLKSADLDWLLRQDGEAVTIA